MKLSDIVARDELSNGDRNHCGLCGVREEDLARCEVCAADAAAIDDRTWLLERLRKIRTKLESIVCTEPPDDGVVLLSDEGPTHTEWDGAHHMQVYDHEHFSPLGDALIELWRMTEVANG